MKCKLCNTNTRCTCRWGWCNKCWASNNRVVQLQNDLLDLGLTAENIKANIEKIRNYEWRTEAYNIFEYLTWVMDEETFNSKLAVKSSSIGNVPFKPTWKKEWDEHEWVWMWAWGKCKKCWCTRRYCYEEACNPKLDENLDNNNKD